jgi:hypothetical protein
MNRTIPTSKAMGEKLKLEFIARITAPDGKVIERTVEAGGGIPMPDDFDMSTKMGFLESFDVYEKTAIEARNKVGEEITAEYLAEVSKKNETKGK